MDVSKHCTANGGKWKLNIEKLVRNYPEYGQARYLGFPNRTTVTIDFSGCLCAFSPSSSAFSSLRLCLSLHLCVVPLKWKENP